MSETHAIHVGNDELAAHAERLLAAQRVRLPELAIAFDESAATSAALFVEGESFYPRILDDLERATSSIHIVQFGFKPGKVGDVFAATLAEKAREGVAVRLCVDNNGSAPDRGSRAMYEQLVAAGAEVCVNRGAQVRAAFGPVGNGGARRWNLESVGHIDHRKLLVVDGRTGWVGGAGIEDHFEDGRFHDVFVRFDGPVVSQLQLVFLASLRRLGGTAPVADLPVLFPPHAEGDAVPATVLHNAPGPYRPITDAIGELIGRASETLDVVNPYVTDRGMIRRIEQAAQRGVRTRLFVPATPNNWACGGAELHHHRRLIRAGVAIYGYPTMLHAKAFVRDGEDVLVGTCNLEAWSLKRFFEIDVRFRSRDLAAQFEERFTGPAVDVSTTDLVAEGLVERAKSAALALASPLL